MTERWERWHTCSLCEQDYHGVVACALGWACWKTYVGRPETDQVRRMAMSMLGNGLSDAEHHEDALAVKEAELSMQRRWRIRRHIARHAGQSCGTYAELGRHEKALRMRARRILRTRRELNGEEHEKTLRAASDWAASLKSRR